MPDTVPQYWDRMCRDFLGTSSSLSVELWKTYRQLFPEKVESLRFALNKLTFETAPASLEIIRQRLQTASSMLTPATLLAVSLRLSPEGRRGRRRDVVKFEQRLLDRVSARGDWL
jgi:hypothetical protein